MNIENFKRGAALVRQGVELFAGGPLEHDLDNLVASYELLITRFAPFKVNDRVELAKTPTIDEKTSWGWMCAKHYLKQGALGTVRDVSCGTRGFRFYVSFDDESWVSSHTKTVNPTPHEHRYAFGEEWLRLPC